MKKQRPMTHGGARHSVRAVSQEGQVLQQTARAERRALPWDWYPGVIPKGVFLDDTAYCETTFSFHFYRSRLAGGVEYGRGASTYLGTMFDVGPRGRVKLGEYALVHGARIICDSEIIIGDYALISWNVVLMDTYRVPFNRQERREELKSIPNRKLRLACADVPAKPIHIEPNVWIGFDSCVLPGVTIGRGAVVGAKSVVTENVPPFTVVAGNPARAIRTLDSSGAPVSDPARFRKHQRAGAGDQRSKSRHV